MIKSVFHKIPKVFMRIKKNIEKIFSFDLRLPGPKIIQVDEKIIRKL